MVTIDIISPVVLELYSSIFTRRRLPVGESVYSINGSFLFSPYKDSQDNFSSAINRTDSYTTIGNPLIPMCDQDRNFSLQHQ